MIKFLTTPLDSGDILIGLGFSYKNLEMLKQGKPVRINLNQMGVELGFDFTLLIFAGETEQQMAVDIQEAMGHPPTMEVQEEEPNGI